MKKVTLLIILSFTYLTTFAQNEDAAINLANKDSLSTDSYNKNPLRASAIGFGINMGIWGFNRYIMNEDFARISIKTIKRNLKTYPVWDSDKFSTNLIGHPFHGSLYYNAARVNGYSFYWSLPFTLGGSLMWEYAMENEPPSRNDLVATTFGGVTLGEITFRLSDLILDNRSTGTSRFMRELFAGILAPTRLINRIATGEAWGYEPTRGNHLPHNPIHGTIAIGSRNITDHDKTQKYGVGMKASVDYGEVFDYEIEKPYEWFQAKAQLDYVASAFSLTQINVVGALRTFEFYNKNDWQLFGGIFQHFNYFNSKITRSDNSEFRPYYISEAASIGTGLLVEKEGDKFSLEGKYFINGIALGASISDHFKIDNRDYNMGSGFSLKSQTEISFYKKLNFRLRAENYNIYTWMGYDEELDFKDLTSHEKDFLDAQGDRSIARLYLIGLTAEYNLSNNVFIGLERYRYIRQTTYRYMSKVKYSAWDDFLFVGYKF